MEARGKEEFTARSVDLYDAPSVPLLEEAIKEVKQMPSSFPEPTATLTAKEAVKVFEKTIDDYGLAGWRVKVKEELVSDAIAGKENTIFIRADAMFTKERLKGTIAHEVETHVLGLFTTEQFKNCFELLGLHAEFRQEGPFRRGLHIARN